MVIAESSKTTAKPQYVTALEAAYGPPSQAGFGSAVFCEPIGADDSLADAALAAAFDDPAVTELRVFNLGDGGAMSGILVAARRATGDATFLVFLLD